MATINGDAAAMFVLHLSVQLLKFGMSAEEAASAETSLLKESGLFDGPEGVENCKVLCAGIEKIKGTLERKDPENV